MLPRKNGLHSASKWALLFGLCTACCYVPYVGAYIRAPSFAAGRTPPEMWMSTVRFSKPVTRGSYLVLPIGNFFMSLQPDLIKRAGYRCETHEVQTEDGFLLSLHRVMPKGAKVATGVPILAGHGLHANSEQWVVRNDKYNIVFQFVNHGFDVWLSNYRGSFYGRKHATLSPNTSEFWDFSWHESGVYDQPAFIDHILGHTNHTSLITLGHSMSCIVELAMLTERPEYATKVRGSFFMAPPAYFTKGIGSHTLLRFFGNMLPFVQSAYTQYVQNNMMPFSEVPFYFMCYLFTGKEANIFCKGYIAANMGPSTILRSQENLAALAFSSHYPAGSSIRQSLHFAQSIVGQGFRKYNFGAQKNRKLYGSTTAPSYNLSKVTTPVFIYSGATDFTVTYDNVKKLASELPTTKRLYKIPSAEFNHIDYFVAKAGVIELIETLIDDMNSLTPTPKTQPK